MSDATTDRARVYALLASGFSYPDAASFAEMRSGRFGLALKRAGLPVVSPRPAETTLTLFQAAWLHAFDEVCPPYEGNYRPPSERSALLIEVRAFYRHFGLSMAEGGELEDHLAAELDFMRVLARGRASRRAQGDFLDRHLRSWLPRFAADARRRLSSPFFRGLAGLAAAFVAKDRP
ncbi:MAG: molecular chaperone TorD family protein [Alphaproteobacteria bacterium]|nr:molecular chaperone TorD family protein [Alphaproteobacteria bacterium]